jgi:aminobenzoyl-glutamate transport protein
MSSFTFQELDPRTVVRDEQGEIISGTAISVKNLLAPKELTQLISGMVKTFTSFPPLGVVLVAMLGVGVAERTGFLNAGIKYLLDLTPKKLLTPALLLVAIVSHSAGDTGYILVVPLGGLIFASAGRHPIAGITLAFAGVSGGFSANFLPSAVDPLLQGFTESAAQIIDPERTVNPLCNWYFMAASCSIIVGAGWYLNDRVLEPRLNRTLAIDGQGGQDSEALKTLKPEDRRGFFAGLSALGLMILLLVLAIAPGNSPLRSPDGELASQDAPLMSMIVPLIALFAFLPSVVHGYVSGTMKSHRDVIKAMADSMNTMGYYMVMAFCAAQFTYVFSQSNLGALLAIKGAGLLEQLQLPGGVTLVGIIFLSAGVNLLIGSASAKWALLGPILVPMLMQLGYSPELTQAAYRVGDSSTNILTPLLPYFPLIVIYCQRHASRTGVGTLISTMLPYALAFLFLWTALLLVWWGLGLPLGLQSSYTP